MDLLNYKNTKSRRGRMKRGVTLQMETLIWLGLAAALGIVIFIIAFKILKSVN